MKIQISLENINEFIYLMMSAASLKVISDYEKKNPQFFVHEWSFWDRVESIIIDGYRTWYVEKVEEGESDQGEFLLVNYMLNENQIENSSVYIKERYADVTHKGEDEVMRRLIYPIARSFVMRIGWRTDYCEYLIRS